MAFSPKPISSSPSWVRRFVQKIAHVCIEQTVAIAIVASMVGITVGYFLYPSLALRSIPTSAGLMPSIDYSAVSFAGESFPTPAEHPFARERFERELAIVRWNIYQFILYAKRAPRFFPTIEQELKTAGIPDDFKYLAVAESALKEDITSTQGAAGIWQFMPDTARQYGLRVDESVDERANFEKATLAAARYLKDIHKRFGSWTLTAAAYNRGENGLDRAIANQQVRSYYDLYLNEETARYIYRILAIKYAMEHASSIFGINFLGQPFSQPNTRRENVQGPLSIGDIAKQYNNTYANIRELNPWIMGEKLPAGSWEVRVLDNRTK